MPDLTLEWFGTIEARLIGSQPDGYFFTATNPTSTDDFYDTGWTLIELRHASDPATVLDTYDIGTDYEAVSIGCEDVTLLSYNSPGLSGTQTVLRVSAAADTLTVDTIATGLPFRFQSFLTVEPGGTQFAYVSRTVISWPTVDYAYEVVDIATGTVVDTYSTGTTWRYLLAMPAPDRIIRYNSAVGGGVHELIDTSTATVLDSRDRSDFAPQANDGNVNGDWGYNFTLGVAAGKVFSACYVYDPDDALYPIVATIDTSADTLNFVQEPQGFPVTPTRSFGVEWWWSVEPATSGNRAVWTFAGENDSGITYDSSLYVIDVDTLTVLAQTPARESIDYGTRSIDEGDLGIVFAGDYIIHAAHPLTMPSPNTYREWTVWKMPAPPAARAHSLRQRQVFNRYMR